MIVTFRVLDHIVVNGPLLDRVGEYLDSAGQDHLAQMLFDLQQDAGLKVFNDIGNDAGSDEPVSADVSRVQDFVSGDGDDFEFTPPLLENYEDIPPQRLAVFGLIERELEERGGLLHADFVGFHEELKDYAAPKPGPRLDESAPQQKFTP